MSSRHRQSVARPTPGRHSIAPTPGPTPGSSRSVDPNVLPPYKKPSHPLDQASHYKIRAIYTGATSQALKDHNKQAVELITKAAEGVNDHLRDREQRVVRRRQKWEAGKNLDQQEQEERELKKMQEDVSEATRKLEESMRHIIDISEATQRIEETLSWVRDNAPGRMNEDYNRQTSQRGTQLDSQTRARRDENSDEDMEDEGPTPGPTPIVSRVAITGLSEMFTERMERKKNEYLSFSHQARYAKNNSYIGFKAVVHDAKYGDDGPPLPHPDTWFTDRGSPALGVTATQEGAEDDDDIVIDKATVSVRCPITFQQFKEPYTSKKCPHSFEKTAILEFIRRSNQRVGNSGPRGLGEKAIQCPVQGCEQVRLFSILCHVLIAY